MRIPCLPVADIELPREVGKLYELAYNLWWTWSPMARRLFNSIDSVAWAHYRNPVELLIGVERSHWESLLGNEIFMTSYTTVIDEFGRYMEGEERCAYHGANHDGSPATIAYFCMEYGVHECLHCYSGGLGVLSGDHLKGASDLCLPLVGLGLLYRRGYFRQAIDADGRQQHIYPLMDFHRLPVRPAADPTGREVVVSVDLPGRQVLAKIWVAQVGRVPLLLLDTDISANDPADRPITGILYVRGREMRLVQELILGIAGVRALQALDIRPTLWHLNEGHSVFLQVERLRELLQSEKLPLDEARRRLASRTVFTTHTPVPAGNEMFDRPLVRKYLQPLAAAMDVDAESLLDLGVAGEKHPETPFNLTACAIRTSRFTNGVSRLHAQVSNNMWRHLFPGAGPGDSPIHAITNGVHTPTWLGMQMLDLFNRRLGSDWVEGLWSETGWDLIHEIPEEEIWSAHMAQKERLARFARIALRFQFARHGRSPDELRELDGWFDPGALTIGFARRFATYKRAHLLFSDLGRLHALLADPQRPVQVFLAGKAHPADRPGQELIQHLFELSQSAELRGKVFFLEGYDMRVARAMLRGVDLWLNTPRRPQEASGTSGMKAALNGALNLSVLDGWWPEAYDGKNGWVIGSDGDYHGDESAQDRDDAASLYAALEGEILPAYFERDERGLPLRWIRMMKDSIATIMYRFSAQRMVKEYADRAYFDGLAGLEPGPPGN